MFSDSLKEPFPKYLNEVVTSIAPLDDTGWNDNSRAGLLSYLLKIRGFPRRTEISGLNMAEIELQVLMGQC